MNSRKLALITGSGKKRLGNVIAHGAADRGYDVAVHYHTSHDEAEETCAVLRKQGVRAESFSADLGKPDETIALVQKVIAAFGHIDLLVTCASLWQKTPLEELTPEILLKSLQIDTIGTFLCCQHAGLQMVKQPDGGSIITIGDHLLARPYKDYAAYYLAKGSIPTLTAVFAKELAIRNPRVRVNCIHPGPVLLPDEISAEEKQQILSRSLVRSPDKAKNLADAVFALAENSYITGTCLPLDGGTALTSKYDS